MPAGSALILAPCTSIHTFFMRFPIDVAFVDRQGVIVKITTNLRPWRIAVALRGYAVVEMPAGTLTATSTKAGDTVQLSLV
jgi:uncharacterized membrane protein (UPF0127 family)